MAASAGHAARRFVDLRLVETMGRVVALTLLTPTEPGYGARVVRRAAPAAIPMELIANPKGNRTAEDSSLSPDLPTRAPFHEKGGEG